jgi:hypothetical protein
MNSFTLAKLSSVAVSETINSFTLAKLSSVIASETAINRRSSQTFQCSLMVQQLFLMQAVFSSFNKIYFDISQDEKTISSFTLAKQNSFFVASENA